MRAVFVIYLYCTSWRYLS